MSHADQLSALAIIDKTIKSRLSVMNQVHVYQLDLSAPHPHGFTFVTTANNIFLIESSEPATYKFYISYRCDFLSQTLTPQTIVEVKGDIYYFHNPNEDMIWAFACTTAQAQELFTITTKIIDSISNNTVTEKNKKVKHDTTVNPTVAVPTGVSPSPSKLTKREKIAAKSDKKEKNANTMTATSTNTTNTTHTTPNKNNNHNNDDNINTNIDINTFSHDIHALEKKLFSYKSLHFQQQLLLSTGQDFSLVNNLLDSLNSTLNALSTVVARHTTGGSTTTTTTLVNNTTSHHTPSLSLLQPSSQPQPSSAPLQPLSQPQPSFFLPSQNMGFIPGQGHINHFLHSPNSFMNIDNSRNNNNNNNNNDDNNNDDNNNDNTNTNSGTINNNSNITSTTTTTSTTTNTTTPIIPANNYLTFPQHGQQSNLTPAAVVTAAITSGNFPSTHSLSTPTPTNNNSNRSNQAQLTQIQQVPFDSIRELIEVELLPCIKYISNLQKMDFYDNLRTFFTTVVESLIFTPPESITQVNHLLSLLSSPQLLQCLVQNGDFEGENGPENETNEVEMTNNLNFDFVSGQFSSALIGAIASLHPLLTSFSPHAILFEQNFNNVYGYIMSYFTANNHINNDAIVMNETTGNHNILDNAGNNNDNNNDVTTTTATTTTATITAPTATTITPGNNNDGQKNGADQESTVNSTPNTQLLTNTNSTPLNEAEILPVDLLFQ